MVSFRKEIARWVKAKISAQDPPPRKTRWTTEGEDAEGEGDETEEMEE